MDELTGTRDAQMEQRRIRPGDALACWHDDLCRVAPTVTREGPMFAQWFESSVDLLACVPDRAQRVSWAYALACALPPGMWSMSRVVMELSALAVEVRACRR